MRPEQASFLSLRELADETIVYNADRDEATVLDATSRRLFDACDGTRDIAELALLTGLDRASCEVELHRLADAGLVTGVSALHSRRALLGGAAVVGGGLVIAPLVSVALPSVAAAASGVTGLPGANPQLSVTVTSESCATAQNTPAAGTVLVTGSGFTPGTITFVYAFPGSSGPLSVQSRDGSFSFSASGQPSCQPVGNSLEFGYGVTATDSGSNERSSSAASSCNPFV